MAEYRFVTSWHIEAPLDAVFDAVFDSLRWPDWWHGAERVEQLDEGDSAGIGSVRRYTWKSQLPYRLSFDACATRIDRPHVLEANVDGDLRGCGRWTFCHHKGVTVVCYEWNVHTTKSWMNGLAAFARPVFAYNHHVLMQRGAENLAHYLCARLLHVSHVELPPRRAVVNWYAAGTAGLLAGVVATVIQMMLWWGVSHAAPDLLLRDARLAAAIIMGPAVLPPPATFEWNVMIVATLVHVALSIGYGMLLSPIVARLRMHAALVAGMAFGLSLYCINMYGFTAIFPWFKASRDWITAIAHVFFGLSGALIYKLWDKKFSPIGTKTCG